jgi:UDP-2,4-diacetamido-2,4,6-trideoxy-beta-L-altropyranose hydrolase
LDEVRQRVLFRVDASPTIGGGHVMRCLTLADELERHGWVVTFATTTDTIAIFYQRLMTKDVIQLSPQAARSPEALLERLQSKYDFLIVDHYALDHNFEFAFRRVIPNIAVVDDLANRRHECDLLVDSTYRRSVADYEELIPKHCRVLAGSQYALIRPEFRSQRDTAVARRLSLQSVRRVFLSIGLTDVGGLTARLLAILMNTSREIMIDVIVGPGVTGLSTIVDIAASDHRVAVHIDPHDIVELMAHADLAIGAGGTTSWERCCLGLPTLLIVVADNQALIAERLAAAGAVIALAPHVPAFDEQFSEIFSDLSAHVVRLRQMVVASAQICDGLGTPRVRNALEELLPHRSPAN